MPRGAGGTQQNDITVRIGADTTNLTEGMEDASFAVKTFGSVTTAVVAGLATTPALWTAIGASARGAGLAIAGVGAAFRTVTGAAAGLVGSFGAVAAATGGALTRFAEAYPVVGAVGTAVAGVARNFTLLNTAMIGAVAMFSPYSAAAQTVRIATTGASEATMALGAAFISALQRIGLFLVAFQTLAFVIRSFHQESQRLTDVGALSYELQRSIDYANEFARSFERAGVSTSHLRAAVETLTANIQMGLGDATNHTTMLLKALGIETQTADGQMRNMGTIITELMSKLAGYADNARRAQVFTELFGQAVGPEMAQALRTMGRELENVQGEERQTFTADQLQRMYDRQAVTESLNKLYRAMADVVGNILSGAYNLWERAVDGVMDKLKPMFDLITAILNEISKPAPTTWFDAMQRQSQDTIRPISQVQQELETLRAELLRLQETHDPNAWFFGNNTAGIQYAREQIEGLEAELRRLTMGPSGTGWVARISIETGTNQADPNAPTIAQITREQHEAERLRRQAEHDLDQLQHRLDQAARGELRTFMETLHGSGNLLDESTYSWMSYAERVEQALHLVDKAYGGSAQYQQQLAHVQRQLAQNEQKNILETASVAAQTITALWPKSKNAAIAAAVINTGVAVTKALTAGVPPYNFIQAALVAAQGAAQIASIRSTSLSGGSPASVSAGAGASTPQTAPGQPQLISIQGLRPEGRYGGASVIGLLGEINDAVKNGAALISTTTMRPVTQ